MIDDFGLNSVSIYEYDDSSRMVDVGQQPAVLHIQVSFLP